MTHHVDQTRTRPRAGSLGCLGCFAALCLMAFTAIGVGAAWWLNASWFDGIAFWRAPRVEPEILLVDDPGERQEIDRREAAREAADAARSAAPKPIPHRPVPFVFAKVDTDYHPARGAELEDPSGAMLRIPPGAVDGQTKISMVPMLSLPATMDAPLAGPVFDIRSGDIGDHGDRDDGIQVLGGPVLFGRR